MSQNLNQAGAFRETKHGNAITYGAHTHSPGHPRTLVVGSGEHYTIGYPFKPIKSSARCVPSLNMYVCVCLWMSILFRV